MRQIAIQANFATEEEYFLFDEKSKLRHELVNGYLCEMDSVSIFHIDIVSKLILLFEKVFVEKQYRIAFESYKFRTPEGNFFYPNFMICESDSKRYYTEKPVLIAEILSSSTRKLKMVDKFIQYQKAETLQYYLCIEPRQKVIFFYFKQTKASG